MKWELLFDVINALGIVLDMIGVILSFKFVSKRLFEGLAAYQKSVYDAYKEEDEIKFDKNLKLGLWYFFAGFFLQMLSAIFEIFN